MQPQEVSYVTSQAHRPRMRCDLTCQLFIATHTCLLQANMLLLSAALKTKLCDGVRGTAPRGHPAAPHPHHWGGLEGPSTPPDLPSNESFAAYAAISIP